MLAAYLAAVSGSRISDRAPVRSRLLADRADTDAARLPGVRLGDRRADLYRRRAHAPPECDHVPATGSRACCPDNLPARLPRKLFQRHNGLAVDLSNRKAGVDGLTLRCDHRCIGRRWFAVAGRCGVEASAWRRCDGAW